VVFEVGACTWIVRVVDEMVVVEITVRVDDRERDKLYELHVLQ
jgi:hypothetical protein